MAEITLPPQLEERAQRSAAPNAVRATLVNLAARDHEGAERVAADEDLARAVVAVAAASNSLGQLVVTEPAVLEVLGDLDRRPDPPEAGAPVEELATWKRLELARLAARDLLELDPLEQVTDGLARLGRDVLTGAHAMVLDRLGGAPLAVIGMGKLGAGELNYASDIDVMFVGEGDPMALERAARRLLELAGRCFRVDANLRPEGRDGPLVRSLASYEAYWERWSEAWERQALLKAAPAAGDPELGQRWADAAASVVWERPFTPDDLRAARAMKARSEQLVREQGVADRDVKRGPGGIRDVEFAAQLLQLVHGGADPELRRPATVDALAALASGGYVDPDDAEGLTEAYRFLRRVEHAAQLVDEHQTHAVPEDRAARRRVARTLGYRGSRDAGPTEAFDRDLAAQRRFVRSVHERVWFRPLLESLAGAGALGPEAAASRLAAFGFTDVERTRQAVTELTRGLTRSSRMMQQLLPLLLDWLSAAPDPDLGLLGLRRLVSGEQRARTLAVAFRESPEVARSMALLLGTGRLLTDVLVANPDLIERLADPERLRTKPRDELVRSVASAVGWRGDPDERQRALQRWVRRNLLGIAARDVLAEATVDEVGRDLTALAESVLEAALAALGPQVPFAVLALGRLGGASLGYASDLDIVFVHEGTTADDHEEADRVANGLLRFVGGSSPATRVWEVDADLRPEGRGGPLARSFGSWDGYLTRWAETWERLAYLRARAVAGDAGLGARLIERIDEAVHGSPITDDEVRSIRRMKARIERERIPSGEDPEFHLKLGRGSLSDVEFTVQLLQLQHGVRGSATLGALDELVERGALDPEEGLALAESYRFCERTRGRAHLVGAGGDSLPTRPEAMAHLARSLGVTAPGLREEYRRVTRRARRIVEHRFYGAG
jgi:[glutamine synthetase] adenylyltransferase / [glutamine synthetase]-adenylyl-L-tyrosine phosphorylase